MKFKCLHIITRLANGGAEETLFDLVLQLAQQKIYCDIAVGIESAPEVLEKYSLPEECNIFTIPHMVRNPKPLFEVRALREIRKLIREQGYNIVQTHGSKAGVLGRIAAHKERVPAIIGMIHGISFPPAMNMLSRILYKFLERYSAKLSHALVCVGEDMKQKYLAAKVGVEAQYSVIYTGMNLQNFSANLAKSGLERMAIRIQFGLPANEDVVVLGSIGRLEDRKNQKALIAMLPRVCEQTKNVHLCLIGDGPNLESLKSYAESLGVAKYVTFTGYVSKVWELIPALDIHCMVSLWEGLPRVLVQTSAAGLPNVCYEVDGAWEIVENNFSGFIIRHGDESAYVEALSKLMIDETGNVDGVDGVDAAVARRKIFGARAAEIADSRWSLEKFGTQTIALYEKLLKDLRL